MNLQKYNQKLLAIFGTMVSIALAVILLVALFDFLGDSFFNSRNKPSKPRGVVIDQQQFLDTTAFEYTQQISVLEPYQLDTTQPIFLIPIGQKDQKTRLGKVAVAGWSSQEYASEDYYYSSFSGLFNNFVLVDYTTDEKLPVFQTKVAITEWAYLKIDTTQIILFKGTDTDTDGNGMLNSDDYQSLFVYNVQNRKVGNLRFDNETVLSFEPLSLTSKFYVRTGKDIDGDLEFSSYSEPTDLYFYDVYTGESETLVPNEIKAELQRILGK